jgi:hypothetical protein
MKTPTLIGTIIFGLSILVTAIAVFRLDFITGAEGTSEFFELLFIWIAGIIGGFGMGYGSRESFGYNEGNNATIIGGMGFILSIILGVWMLINESPPIEGIAIAFVGSMLALIGLYIVIVSTQETY